MFAISEQLTQATKAAIDQQLFGLANCAQAAFDAGVGVVDLNVDAVKASMAAAAAGGADGYAAYATSAACSAACAPVESPFSAAREV